MYRNCGEKISHSKPSPIFLASYVVLIHSNSINLLLIHFNLYPFINVNLHISWRISGKPNRKLSNQRCGPFLVKRRVGRLAYELELPPNWRVYPTISVAQLEPLTPGKDPYDRPRTTYPGEVYMEGDTEEYRSYEVERIVKKRVRKFGKTKVTHYLLRRLGWGPEHDVWNSTAALDECMDLVEDFERSERERRPHGRLPGSPVGPIQAPQTATQVPQVITQANLRRSNRVRKATRPWEQGPSSDRYEVVWIWKHSLGLWKPVVREGRYDRTNHGMFMELRRTWRIRWLSEGAILCFFFAGILIWLYDLSACMIAPSRPERS